ncbi:MAG: hypothetical protein HYT35_00365 [Candidatus Staskawiczbacteria bacterium]|nr:hypothetical protein [Candidatus Staskawiczbacteria bacterium]
MPVEKPEQQPAAQPDIPQVEIEKLREHLLPTNGKPEKVEAPIDMKSELDEAKKYLEKLYSPEKSSEIVDRSIPLPEKPIDKAQVKAARNELIDLAKGINEARERKEVKTEMSLFDRAREVFETATGKDLEKKASGRAKVEAQSEGLRITTIEEYRKEGTAKIQERIRQKERSTAIKERWDMLSDKEKEKYFEGSNNKNNISKVNSARIKFAMELREKIEAKRQELAKGKNGILISEDVFYELMKKGLKAEDIKKRGFFRRMFFGGDVKAPPLDKTDGRGSLIADKEYLAQELELRVKKNIEEAAQEEMERKIIEGQRRWKEKKQRHMRELVEETATEFATAPEAAPEAAPVAKTKRFKREVPKWAREPLKEIRGHFEKTRKIERTEKEKEEKNAKKKGRPTKRLLDKKKRGLKNVLATIRGNR